MWVENDCIYTICFDILLILILQLKIWYKAIQNWLNLAEQWLTKAWISGPTDDSLPDFFLKMH